LILLQSIKNYYNLKIVKIGETLTDNELMDLANRTISILKNTSDISSRLNTVHDAIHRFIPYDSMHILSIDSDRGVATTMEHKDTEALDYPLEQKGILAQCYESHHPLLINDVNRSLLYNKETDGRLNSRNSQNITKVLVVPIMDNSASKDILGILWIGLYGGVKQFIQEDIDHLMRFANATKGYLFEDHKSEQKSSHDALLICKEAKRVLKVQLERHENYFASTIHDIRTPMNAVIGFMELMMLNETDTQKRDYIDATLKSGEHIVTLINDALDMSKISSGKMSLEKTIFPPIDRLSDIAKLFYNSMRKKSIDFEVFIDPKMPALIKSDVHRIKQIVNNLLSNAMKFTPVDGEVYLKATYDKESDTLRVSVLDTGIGIAKEKHKSIFNPYAQETTSTSREYGGTGLGLAISQQLSVLLDGTLTLDSTQGEGSEFVLTIPCDTPQDTKQSIDVSGLRDANILIYQPKNMQTSTVTIQKYLNALEIPYHQIESRDDIKMGKNPTTLIIDRLTAVVYKGDIQQYLHQGGCAIIIENNFESKNCPFNGNFKPMHNPILPNPLFDMLQLFVNPKEQNRLSKADAHIDYDSLKGHSVLVVDDSLINLKLMTEILKRFDLDTSTCINAREALELLQERSFDIIFIDQNMPIMVGDQAIAEIRQNEKNRDLKHSIIYGLTGDTNKDVIDRIMLSGADGVLTKPVHIEEIYGAISKGLQR